MTAIAVDKVALQNIAQWLEARGDPVQSAQELRAIVASAPAAADPEHVADMELETKSYGRCRGRIHSATVCDCRFCRITRRISP